MRDWMIVLVAILGWTAAAATEPVTFATSLNAKFHHERCLSCHQFNSPQHQGRAFGSHRSRYACSQCHRPDVIGLPPNTEWIAPNNMDYTDFTSVDTCRMIKRRIGFDPNGQKLVRHLLTDGRVRWALESGMTPAGQKEVVPGGYVEWQRDVDAWVKDGKRCE
jgi:cytochrome c551/c552